MRQRNTNANSKCNANGNCHPDTNSNADCNSDTQTCPITQTSTDAAASPNTSKVLTVREVRAILRDPINPTTSKPIHSEMKPTTNSIYIAGRFARNYLLERTAPLILVLLLVGPVVGVAQTIWTDGTGDWFLGANWSAGVPNSSTQAQVNNSGTAQITTSGAAAASILLGWNDVSELGNLSISGAGRLTVQQDLAVGGLGNGTFSVTNGAQVSDFSGEVGYTVTSHPGVSGNATVDGAGSSWTHASDLYVGYGTGTLTISNGATVSNAFGYLGYFGEFPGRSNGTVTVTGQSSAWTNSFDLWTGENGTGVLNISNGGSVSNGTGQIGYNFGADGTATIDGSGSTWTSNGFFYVGGEQGGNGILNVTNGGHMNSNGSFAYVGYGAASQSSATIDGADSLWNNFRGLYVGFNGHGTLAITNG